VRHGQFGYKVDVRESQTYNPRVIPEQAAFQKNAAKGAFSS
jgi:hypothetical protein